MNGIFAEANVPNVLENHTLETINAVRKRLMGAIDQTPENFGAMDPRITSGVRQTIGDWSQSGDSQLRYYGGRLANALDDAVGRSAAINNPADAAALRTARNQFINLDKLTDPNVIDQKTGNISITGLFNKFKNTDIAQTGSGPQDMWRLARAGATLIPDKVGNSGTARRLLSSAGLGAAGVVGGALATGNLNEALKYGALGVGLPFLGGKINDSALTRGWVGSTAYNPIAGAIREGLTKVGAQAGGALGRGITSGQSIPGTPYQPSDAYLLKQQEVMKKHMQLKEKNKAQ